MFYTLILLLLLLLFLFLYINQEKLIFFPEKLPNNYNFTFTQNKEEFFIKTKDGITLNGLLFKTSNPLGLIFYLHGNAGSLSCWGEVGKIYNDLNYDLFIYDYRGYGKSEGKIISEKQLFEDNQLVYNKLIQHYEQSKIIILGYSIGTGLASNLASNNSPKLLILQAPYYNLVDLIKKYVFFNPTFLLKYKFKTNEFLKKCDMPIVIFHGDKDNVIYYGSALKLKNDFTKITLIILKEQGHNGMTYNEKYLHELKAILKNC